MATGGEPDLEEGAQRTGVGEATTSTVTDVKTLKERMDDYDKRWKDVKDEKHTIFRVPRNLREVGGKAYIPQMVSIGPYHYGNRRLEDMQKHKLRLLRQFLDRTEVGFDVCFGTMIGLERKVKSRYAGLADNEAIGSNEFAEIMLLDACFILELFDHHSNGGSKFDPFFCPRAFIPCIRRDLLMLENQIPLFVLEILFDLVPKKNDEKLTVASLALHFFMPAIESTEGQMKKPLPCSMCFQSGSHRGTGGIGIGVNNRNDVGVEGNNTKSPKQLHSKKSTKQLHLLHIIRQSFLRSYEKTESSMPNDMPPTPNDSHQPHSMPNEMHPTPTGSPRLHSMPNEERPTRGTHRPMTHCVSMLRDHGIKFKQKHNSTKIIDISFEGGHLHIPQLVINYSTRSILLNLMAFEQCYSQCGNHVTSYVNFMDGLINGPRDVSYLQHLKIIVHRLGSEEAVARLFNQLCREMTFDTHDDGNLSSVSKKIDDFIQKRRHKWWASLKHEYLRHPWAIISICAAMFLLGLTVIGTLYAILSFHIHRS